MGLREKGGSKGSLLWIAFYDAVNDLCDDDDNDKICHKANN